MRRFFSAAPVCTLALFVLFSAAPCTAFEAYYASSQQLNLATLLPPPPAPESNTQKADLSAVLSAQESRTEQQAERAVKDNSTSLFRIADGLFGDQFTPEKLPKVTVFYNHVIGDTVAILASTKDVWNRPRPFAISADVHAIGELPTSGSYPSGHATRGQLTAIILSNMVPEKSTQLFARGREYGENRVVAGVHFPSDIEAGRLSATAIAAVLMENVQFKNDLNEAKAELRGVLGLAP
jgi:acid phosphatase (class A)